MTLSLHSLTAWHWALGGLGIALITLTLQFVGNRSLGLSSGLEDVCALGSDDETFAATAAEGRAWRMPFLAGLLLGGVASALLAGGWSPVWSVEPLDRAFHLSPVAKAAWFFVGGTLTGFGTRLASGCTSGHGIFGVARLQPASLRATAAFMASGVVTSNLLYRVLS